MVNTCKSFCQPIQESYQAWELNKKLDFNNVKRLYLFGREGSSLSDSTISYLKECRELRQLEISDINTNNFIYHVCELSNLTKLTIHFSKNVQLPDCIGVLRKIDTLEISVSRIKVIPDPVYNLNSLRHLNIEGNQLTHIDDLKINNLKELISIDLSENPIKKFEFIDRLKKCVKIDLSGIGFNVLPGQLGRLDELKYLDISSNPITNYNSLSQLINLEELNISSNQIKNVPKELEGCRKLQHLNLSFNKIDNYIVLSKLFNLKELVLLNTGLKTLPNSLVKCSQLRSLNISNNKNLRINEVCSFIAMHLSGIEELDISNCNIKKIPSCVGQLTNLKILHLRGNKISKKNIEYLSTLLPNCKIYYSAVSAHIR
jgi:Leucine-rich repeat (LRR) protein